MPDVEYNFILRRIENAVQRDRQFDNAQVGGKMTAVFGYRFQKLSAYFGGKLRDPAFGYRFEIFGRIYVFEHYRIRRGAPP